MNPTIEETRRRIATAQRHSIRLAQEALRGAGTRRDVARALGRSESTVSHECTTRAHPELARAFEVAILLNGHRGTSARALLESMAEAIELSEIATAETETLVERGLFLMDKEDRLEAAENLAAKSGVDYARALRAEASAQNELAAIIDELATPERGSIDLLVVYRKAARRVA